MPSIAAVFSLVDYASDGFCITINMYSLSVMRKIERKEIKEMHLVNTSNDITFTTNFKIFKLRTKHN